MIESVIFLQYGTLGGGQIGNLLSQLDQIGFFSYLLPFLLIFALVFGLLSKMSIFKTGNDPNVAINAIIALAIAFMSLQFNFVSAFFSEVFPRLGVGLAIILMALILAGLFIPTDKGVMNYILLGLGGTIFVVIINNSFGILGWNMGTWVDEYKTLIIAAVILIVFVVIIVGASRDSPPPKSLLLQSLGQK